jgi:hypothetical protein
MTKLMVMVVVVVVMLKTWKIDVITTWVPYVQ